MNRRSTHLLIALLFALALALAAGCGGETDQQNECMGSSWSCASVSSSSCHALRGCYVDSEQHCRGESWPCIYFDDEPTCADQFGCSWK